MKLKPDLARDDWFDQAGFATICTRFGEDTTAEHGAAVPPIYQTSTFYYPDAEAFAKRQTSESAG